MKRQNKRADTAWNFTTPEEWREAMRRCQTCAETLVTERRISDVCSGYGDSTLHTELESLMERYGQDCVTQVLADTVKNAADWDRRYDCTVVAWAKTKSNFPPFPGKGYGPDGPRQFLTNLHPEYVRAAVHALIAIEREQEKRRPRGPVR